MLDFVLLERDTKKHQIKPTFSVTKRKDLMTKGGRFEAFYNDETGLWSTDLGELTELIDAKSQHKCDEIKEHLEEDYRIVSMDTYNSGVLKSFNNYVKDAPNIFKTLDPHVTFADDTTTRTDYCMHKLDYIMEEGDCSAWDKLIGTLYDEDERRKLEWAIGCLISGDSRKLQKCIFIEGQPGKGKSTVFEILQGMFPYYYGTFTAESLGDDSDQFSLASLASNPLFAIDADAKLYNLTATNRINKVIGHDVMTINEKFKQQYDLRITTMLWMASNYHVRIDSSSSGLMRRILLVTPTGITLPIDEYEECMEKIKFEYGAIAYRCYSIYKELGFTYYNKYYDKRLLVESNEVYNFMKENYIEFSTAEYLTVNNLWKRFKLYLEDSNTGNYKFKKIDFRNDIIHYFEEFSDRKYGTFDVLEGLKLDMFEFNTYKKKITKSKYPAWLYLTEDISVDDNVLNKAYADLLAQEANDSDHPKRKWDNVKTTLKDIDTTKVHYVLPPEKHVIIDFDKKDKDGNKNLELNLEAAKIFPETYAEVSKGGAGLHLHYIYDGDVSELASLFDENVEILTFKGKKALRRRLSLCNNHDISVLKEGQLPKKEVKEAPINNNIVINEKALRTTIAKCLKKEVHSDSTSNINFIYDILEKAYNSDVDYDVSDLYQAVLVFAKNSSKTKRGDLSNIHTVGKMHFCCKKFEKAKEDELMVTNSKGYFEEDAPIAFFDIEIFPNLFLICWKTEKMDECVRMYNPTPDEVRSLFKFRLIGFNNRDYDNHICYAASMGYSVKGLYELSQKIINGDKETQRNAKFGEAYNLSYTDVYDFSSAQNKKGLKKWELELGIQHLENSYHWDEPLPEDKWEEVGDYCCNDVIATEKVFHHLSGDYAARIILSKISGLTPNDTTNQHTTKILCGDKKNPQSEYVYTDLSKEFPGYEFNPYGFPDDKFIPGSKIVSNKSCYKGISPGEGGWKIAYPGYYENVGLLDILSLHPSSIIKLNLFGDEITARFKALVDGRIEVKHIREFGDEHYLKALDILGALGEFVCGIIEDYFKAGYEAGETAKYLAKNLANALKTAINSVYGLTSAPFPNKLKDPRNKDNIVAKRGALFMITLKLKLDEMGAIVVHVSTDSIKIANITPEIIEFVMDFGKQYGYTFEHEATYSKMCIVNDAVYIAEEVEADGQPCEPFWTATGKQFQVPYVFKTLFSHEEIVFDDVVIPFQVNSALYLRHEIGDTNTYDYKFIGRFGSFVPVKEDSHMGYELLRDAGDGKFAAATGSKGYLWAEAEMVKALCADPMSIIDWSFYESLNNDAIKTIGKYIDIDEFVGRSA